MYNIKRDQELDQTLHQRSRLDPNAANDKSQSPTSSLHDPRVLREYGAGPGYHRPNIVDGQCGGRMGFSGLEIKLDMAEYGSQAVQVEYRIRGCLSDNLGISILVGLVQQDWNGSQLQVGQGLHAIREDQL